VGERKQWVDPFIAGLVGVLLLGLLIPVPAPILAALGHVGTWAVALLFFLYGARLATGEVVAALTHWRLQGAILISTFVVFPLLGVLISRLVAPWIGEGFAAGILYLSLLPSTIQSAVVFVSVARGNVAAAISGATLSNLLAMLVTPLLVFWLLADLSYGGGDYGFATGGIAQGAVAYTNLTSASGLSAVGIGRLQSVLLGLLLPFVLGQLVQPWIGDWVRAHKPLTVGVDRGTILLLVFTAVAASTAAGTWAGVSAWTLAILVGIAAVLIAIMLTITWFGGRALGLNIADRITLLDCGSTKSLATGLPMASVLLPYTVLGAVAVPLIIFHQLQLITCSVIARRLARRPD